MSTAETPRIKQSLSFIAYEKIKAMILNMELQPGSSLTEMWLIGKLDMSRTPIREALYRLQQERFVELTRHKGWYVSEIKLRDIQELFVIREALEGICARHATARISDEALTKMEAYLDSLEAPLLANEEAVVDPGDTLHDLIFTYADNQLINTMMAIHLERLRMFHVIASNLPGRKLQSWREHREILYALKARDEDRVEQTMRRHIRSSLDSLLQDLLQKNQTLNAL
ncbi:Putative GntR family transcriptional regulator [Sodalis praecaptivus]|uniref:Putative GntR family transcriptional regulator n=1 Tax=Sodalis praecaptivus TaxID=1239307 RepID=W0HYS5_9GAMM|nr:GntR family transcriptional regulator [Sodalis praecaptivus]AHF77308.1 Putative GntR family transcriptional regulator [Sodalis praecaptivus]